ncbi:MAG: FHA domain-containing protein [Deltaproteobacteria bacterium]|nr:FHA domain-containing protein [Deltaproteobacteria bacterium]
MLRVDLQILKDDEVAYGVPMVTGVLFMGRAPENDVVFSSPGVSGRHAVLYLVDGGQKAVLQDLGSTNGTFLNDRKVRKAMEVADGDTIRLGQAERVRVRLTEELAPGHRTPRPTLVDDLDTGIAWPLRSGRLLIGTAPGCTVRFPGDTDSQACVTLLADGSAWISAENAEYPVAPGEPFLLEGHRFVLRHERNPLNATVPEPPPPARVPYSLEVRLDATEGPRAVIQDDTTGTHCTIVAPSQVSLLYVLAVHLQHDLDRGGPPDELGWCPDEALMQGIWGHSWFRVEPNTLHVLLSRTRTAIRQAGLDGWFIEKRSGRTRIRLDRVRL